MRTCRKISRQFLTWREKEENWPMSQISHRSQDLISPSSMRSNFSPSTNPYFVSFSRHLERLLDGRLDSLAAQPGDLGEDPEVLSRPPAAGQAEAAALPLPHSQAQLGGVAEGAGGHPGRGQGGLRALGLHARRTHEDVSEFG